MHFDQKLANRLGGLAVEVARRLIREQEQRLVNERPRHRDALAFPPRQLRGPMVEPLGQSNAVEQFAGALLQILGRAGERRDQDVFEHRALWQQVMVLKDEPNRAIAKARQLRVRQAERLLLAELVGSGGRPFKRAEQVQQRALARPGRPEDGESFAGLQGEVDVAQDDQFAAAGGIGFAQVLQGQAHDLAIVSESGNGTTFFYGTGRWYPENVREMKVNNLDLSCRRSDTGVMALVKMTTEATAQAEKLPNEIHRRVLKLMKRLEDWPVVSGVKALSDNLAGWYRMRTGDYRLRFRVESVEGDAEGEKIVMIIVDKIGHRKDIYED